MQLCIRYGKNTNTTISSFKWPVWSTMTCDNKRKLRWGRSAQIRLRSSTKTVPPRCKGLQSGSAGTQNWEIVGRNSSVGRALDWRSKGPWFNPGFRQSREHGGWHEIFSYYLSTDYTWICLQHQCLMHDSFFLLDMEQKNIKSTFLKLFLYICPICIFPFLVSMTIMEMYAKNFLWVEIRKLPLCGGCVLNSIHSSDSS